MNSKIKSIFPLSLCNFKAIPLFNKNYRIVPGPFACARFVFAQPENYCSVRSAIYNNHWCCLSLWQISMAEKIIVCQKNNMTKLIELNPEWVLSELPDSLYADGNGNISIDTCTRNDASWIKLTLNTLCINFRETEFGVGEKTFVDIEFRIDDLKINCPALYKRMKEMDAKNKLYKNLNIN
ncbi:MAG: hypothetical protein ABSA76_02165 [Bacteroidales bacterium]